MKLSWLCATTLFLLSTTVAFGAKTHTVNLSAAPADEYFGPQKMSALGIRSRIGALGRKYHARTIADGDLIHDAVIAEGALRAWNERYPRDSWLAPTAFHLEQLYYAVQSPDGRTHATTMLHYITQTFGTTSFGHLSRLRLAQGFPPLQTESALASPTPGAAQPSSSSGPSAVASDAPGAAGSPDAGASPAAAPSPAASTVPSPASS